MAKKRRTTKKRTTKQQESQMNPLETLTIPEVTEIRTLPEITSPELEMSEIHVPLGEIPAKGYLQSHVECRLKTHQQKVSLKRAFRGLQERGEKLENGNPIRRPGDVVRWLMEQI